MRQDELRPAPGSRHPRKRVGRGTGSGHGTTAGRGTKGQKSRSGGTLHPRFRGISSRSQRLPLARGRRFTNAPFKVEYSIVNVGRLSLFPAGSTVGPKDMLAAGLLKTLKKPVKVLGEGELLSPIIVKASKFSASAKVKIEGAGGRVEEVPL